MSAERSYTEQVKHFSNVVNELKEEQKRGFDKLSKDIEGLKMGIHGNKEHDQLGYRQRISSLENTVENHEEFKKKALQLISLITGGVSLVANALIYILSKTL